MNDATINHRRRRNPLFPGLFPARLLSGPLGIDHRDPRPRNPHDVLVAGLLVLLAILFYQTINFHHYIVDSRIWKVRKKPMQETMSISPT